MWKNYLNTPFRAVETAMQSIKKEADINGKREFWLIVLTDGAFNELEKEKTDGKEQITQKLAQFKKKWNQKNIIASSFNNNGRKFRSARATTDEYVQRNLEERNKWHHHANKWGRWGH